MARDNKHQHICAFCGRDESQVNGTMLQGRMSYLCSDCIYECMDFLQNADFDTTPDAFKSDNVPKPKEIKAILDEYVIGQDKAKKALSVSVYNHYKRLESKNVSNDVEIQKTNILMLGPTGCGKTFLAQTLAKILDVPFCIADATTLTEAGYVGEDVENILLKLIQAADYDIEQAKRGIIYIDEIDKISRRSENPSITRDVSGEGVQQSLLKIIEGTVASVPPQGGRKHPHQEFIQIDTSDILFICGGAFDGLDKIIENRIGKKTLGFGAEVSGSKQVDKGNIFAHVTPQDLLKFGLIPEFIGRLPMTVSLEALVRVLKEPKNSLVKQYKKIFEYDGVELEFDDDAMLAVAKEAINRNTGARGLRAILEETMLDVMYEIPSDESVEKCIIHADCITDKKAPELVLKKASKKPKSETA